MASAKNGSSKQRSGVLGQTLQELESAFADWEALSDAPQAAVAAPLKDESGDKNADRRDVELRKKTKKLLDQLRQQLAELAD